jgi:hypothetical protein
MTDDPAFLNGGMAMAAAATPAAVTSFEVQTFTEFEGQPLTGTSAALALGLPDFQPSFSRDTFAPRIQAARDAALAEWMKWRNMPAVSRARDAATARWSSLVEPTRQDQDKSDRHEFEAVGQAILHLFGEESSSI